MTTTNRNKSAAKKESKKANTLTKIELIQSNVRNFSMLVLGIDPDNKKNGVSVWLGGRMIDLKSLDIYQLYDYLSGLVDVKKYNDVDIIPNIVIAIENINDSSAAWNAKKAGKGLPPSKQLGAQLSAASDLGKNRAAQDNIEALAAKLKIPVIHYPVSSKWKESAKGKAMLKEITGWSKASNEDNRSGAYFGYTACCELRIYKQPA